MPVTDGVSVPVSDVMRIEFGQVKDKTAAPARVFRLCRTLWGKVSPGC
jgi:hypothetical protein